MGNGQDVLMPYLNSWFKKDPKNPYREEADRAIAAGKHPVPQGSNELQASQNLFLLEAGARGVATGEIGAPLEQQLISRLKRERDEIGLWGSECTSPIYHHFIITGLSAIYHSTGNQELKALIEQNLGSFFWYALKMGLAHSKHGLIGMRGTGHDFATSGFPQLHFVCQYFTSGRPKNYGTMSGWKDWLKDTGWVMAGLPGGRSYDLYKKVFEYAVDDDWKPWRLRSKLTFIEVDSFAAGHFYEKGINGNTPALIAYVFPSPYRMQGGYLPLNSAVRVRQKHDNSTGGYEVKDESVYFTYDGIYTSLTNGLGETQARAYCSAYMSVVDVLTSDLSGVSGWARIHPSASVPVDAPPPTVDPPVTRPRKKKTPWWMFWK